MQFITRSIIDDFEYEYIYGLFSDKQLERFKNWIYNGHHENINKSMTIKLNSEWITRSYLSSKMILSATVMITSLEYAIEKNLKITVPYLYYYSLITCCRAFLYVNPYNQWNKDESFLKMNHSKIINFTKDYLNHLDSDYALKIANMLNELKESREFFSYKFPATGLRFVNTYQLDEVIEVCSILCELAQLASEQIQKYVFKNCTNNHSEWGIADMDLLKYTYRYNGIIDGEDWHRIDYIRRKQPFPTSIYYTMTEGMTEDYFGAWFPDEEQEYDDVYNPDIDWRRIFPVP